MSQQFPGLDWSFEVTIKMPDKLTSCSCNSSLDIPLHTVIKLVVEKIWWHKGFLGYFSLTKNAQVNTGYVKLNYSSHMIVSCQFIC